MPSFAVSLFRALTAGGWVSYVMPWTPINSWATLAMPWSPFLGGVCAASLLLFAYLFPQPLAGAQREARIVGLMLGLLGLAEFAFAVGADAAILAGKASWRPEWFVGWMNMAMVWTIIVFWRQLASAQTRALPERERGRMRWIAGGVRVVVQRPANREASAARAFLLLTLLPILYSASLFLPDDGKFGCLLPVRFRTAGPRKPTFHKRAIRQLGDSVSQRFGARGQTADFFVRLRAFNYHGYDAACQEA